LLGTVKTISYMLVRVYNNIIIFILIN